MKNVLTMGAGLRAGEPAEGCREVQARHAHGLDSGRWTRPTSRRSDSWAQRQTGNREEVSKRGCPRWMPCFWLGKYLSLPLA